MASSELEAAMGLAPQRTPGGREGGTAVGGVCCVVFSGLNGGNPQESWVGMRQKLRKALITLRIGRALRSKASALKLSGLFNYCVSPT